MGTGRTFNTRMGLLQAMAVVSLIFLVPAQSLCADIRLVGNQIEITGDIVEGDFKKFDKIVRQSNWPHNPIVRLRSNGGRMDDAIWIGLAISQKNYHTYGDKGDCLSACALIWLAGKKRFRHPENRMGFHQTHDGKSFRAQGNAAVGWYLAKLNLDYSITLFVTEAAPRRMKFLTRENARKAGISYSTKMINIHDVAASQVPVPTMRAAEGTLEYPDGRVYLGDLIGGVPEGDGVMVWPNSDRYLGGWEDGKRSGNGIFTGRDHVYIGEWKHGHKHGVGEEQGSWGRYSGEFRRGSWHGKGKLETEAGSIYAGYFKNGFAEGPGRLQNDMGHVYRGRFRNGLFHGQGWFAIGGLRIYDGEWRAGVPHGEGRYVFDNFGIFAGQWQDGLRHGMGRLTLADGSTSAGEWRYGLKDGVVTRRAPERAATQTEFDMGFPVQRASVQQRAVQPTGNGGKSELENRGSHDAAGHEPAFSIHLASHGSSEAAERTLKSLARIYPELFDGRQAYVEEYSSDYGGAVFKVFVTAGSDVDAREFCQAFRNHGRHCEIQGN